MAGPIPTKKIPELTAYGTALQGTEQLEIWSVNTSRRITARDFVLPIDSIITVTPFAVPGSNARQLVSSPTVQVTDGGPGGTVQLDALITGALPGNPTALVGLVPINGVAVTWMRSDAAPALNQGIAPNWTAQHVFSLAGSAAAPTILVSSNAPVFALNETDAAADNRRWLARANAEAFSIAASTDDGVTVNNAILIDRTGAVIDSIALAATTVTVNGQNVRDAAILTSGTVATARLASGVADATTWLRGDQTWQALPGGFTGFANPTASIGLAAVNGAATTAMRSDAAPALSQSIVPTWTGKHTFTGVATAALGGYAVNLNSAAPGIQFNESDAAANNRLWAFLVSAEQMQFRVDDDAFGASSVWMQVDRTGVAIDAIALASTALTWNGNPISTAVGANPTASVELTAINGVATTFMRSDGAPALSQAIAPTWTAQHIFSLSGATNAAIFVSSAQPQTDWNETDAAANNRRWRLEVQSEQFLGRVVNDANSAAVTWLAVDRTANTIDQIGFPNGVVRVGNNQTEVFTSAGSQLRVAADGAAQFGLRNCTSDVEAFMGCDSNALFFGTVSAHQINIYTANTLRFTLANAAPTTGASTPTLSANKPGANAGVSTWISVLSSAGVQMWIPCFGN